MEVKGESDSFYAVDYVTRVANELGADMVKINIPDCKPVQIFLGSKPQLDPNMFGESMMRIMS